MSTPKLRIASLISSGTEILYGLGLGDTVVAVSHECDYPPQATAKPRATLSNVDSQQSSGAIDTQVKQLSAAGSALYEIDRDLLWSLRPDVIVTQAQCDVCAVRYQDVIDFVRDEPALADTQVIALNPQSLDDVLADITRIGEAVGTAEQTSRYVASLQSRIDSIRQRTRTIQESDRPRVVCIEWIEPLMLAANWTPELIDIAGGRCPLTQAGEHSGYSAWDDVVHLNPEVIVIAPCGFNLQRTIQESAVIPTWSAFAEISAVKNCRVFAVDGNAYLNRSGPRLVDSVELLAHLFHPGIFASPVDQFVLSRGVFAELAVGTQ